MDDKTSEQFVQEGRTKHLSELIRERGWNQGVKAFEQELETASLEVEKMLAEV